MSITYDYIDDYLYRIAQPRDELLERMEEYADTNNVPIIGPLVGRFLYNLARSSKSKKVLEIGTAIGYSGIWLARAIAPLKGSLTTIDMNPQRVKLARQNLAEAGLDLSVKVIEGNALAVLPTLKEEYDMIFLDSDKDVYSDAFKMSVPLLRKGGLFVADNALWGGDVAKGGKSTDTQSMIKFNRIVSESKGMSTVILPLRDGVLVSLKE
ncbi:MAG TPA: O-methyltransferase [Candidatus Dormibacteraeota bacterium]|nr:O-methyltransferase [Candidatus Dormibacteraeota bacterium]